MTANEDNLLKLNISLEIKSNEETYVSANFTVPYTMTYNTNVRQFKIEQTIYYRVCQYF